MRPQPLLLYNARIHTLDPDRPTATGLLLSPGKRADLLPGCILAVGDGERLKAELAGGAHSRDLQGRVVLPGLIDAHLHLEGFAFSLQKINCETPSRAECLQRVAAKTKDSKPGSWILGHGWNQNEWPEGFGTAADLDTVAPDNPVYLTAKSLHAAWANSAALRAAGVNRHTPDPPGGHLQRDPEGNPTGVLLEGAMQLVATAVPKPAHREVAQAILEAQPVLWKLGVTGVHDFDRERCFSALQELDGSRQLQLRVLKSLPVEYLPQAVALGLRSGFGNDFLRIGSIKAFADGALGPRTAAMLLPYQGEPHNRGVLLMDGEELLEHGRLAGENGLSMAVHAIGDQANHQVLRAFSQLRAYERSAGLPPRRHRIEHVQVLHPDDLPLLGQLQLMASMQPIHATSDMSAADRYWGDRSALAYAWRSLLDRGARLVFGSDAPVDSPNPFWGLHAAVTRRQLDGSPGPDGWYPGQRLSLSEAVLAYTQGAAFAAGMEDRLGKLAPGFLPDLLVLDQDPWTSSPESLKETLPVGVMIDGEWMLDPG